MPKVKPIQPVDAWLEALLRIQGEAANDEGLTAREWAQHLGICKDTAAELLGKAKARGILKVGQRYIENLHGARHPVPVYRVENKG